MNTKICPVCNAPIPAGAPGGLCPACVLRDAEEPPAPADRAAPSVEEVATAFPRLEVSELIGQGGMGFVYKARQPSLDRTVALKILSPELGRDPAFAERFAREARVLAKLHHPNIVTVFEHGESGGFFYLLMEFVDGVNLRQAMRAGRFTPQQALAVVPGICDALQFAHDQGVVHRDIKPENILMDRRGSVKVADFGIAKIVARLSGAGNPSTPEAMVESRTTGLAGTPQYMAPEQTETPNQVDHRADIYALGVVFYQMLTGELPGKRIEPPSSRMRGLQIDVRLDEVVLRALEKNPEMRWPEASIFKTQVETIATNLGNAETQPAEPEAPRDGTSRAMRRAKGLGMAAAGLLVTGVLGTILLLVLFPREVEIIAALGSAAVFLSLILGVLGWRNRAGKFVAVTAGVVLVVAAAWTTVSIPVITPPRQANAAHESLMQEREMKARIHFNSLHAALAEMNEPGRNYALGPVVERVLPEPARGVACMLEFESGVLHRPGDEMADLLKQGERSIAARPGTRDWPQVTESRYDWLRSSEINAVAAMPGRDAIRLFAVLAFPIAGRLEELSSSGVAQVVRNGMDQEGTLQLFTESFRSMELISLSRNTSDTFAFITPRAHFGSATLGVVEIVGPSASPRGVKIRYRLVKRMPDTPRHTTATPAASPAPGEREYPLERAGDNAGKPAPVFDDGKHWYPWAGYIKDGDMRRSQGDPAGALESYRKSLERTRNGRNLAESQTRIGDVQCMQGDLTGALKSYQASVAIRERLDRQDSDNRNWRDELAHGYVKIGDVQSAQGDRTAALESYRKAVAIALQFPDGWAWKQAFEHLPIDYKPTEPFNGEELARLVEEPKGGATSREYDRMRRMMWLINRAGAEKDARFRYLLDRKDLRQHPVLTLTLIGYDYSINGNQKALDYILAKLAEKDVGSDVGEVVVMEFIDEWDRTTAAVKSHFTASDGAGSISKGSFWSTRQYLFPRSFLQYQGKAGEGAPIRSRAKDGTAAPGVSTTMGPQPQ